MRFVELFERASRVVGAVGQFYVGSILTPKDGGVATIGNNDGGSGGQYGGMDLGHPTADSPGANAFTDPKNAYDLDTTTSATGTDNNVINTPKTHFWKSFTAAAKQARGEIKLKVASEASFQDAGSGTLRIRYSKDGGTNWTTLVSGVHGLQVDSATLPQNQDLSQLQVEGFSDWSTGTGAVILRIYEVWVEVAY